MNISLTPSHCVDGAQGVEGGGRLERGGGEGCQRSLLGTSKLVAQVVCQYGQWETLTLLVMLCFPGMPALLAPCWPVTGSQRRKVVHSHPLLLTHVWTKWCVGPDRQVYQHRPS
jgi:hypothetical protein